MADRLRHGQLQPAAGLTGPCHGDPCRYAPRFRVLPVRALGGTHVRAEHASRVLRHSGHNGRLDSRRRNAGGLSRLYYVRASHANLDAFYAWTVPARMSVLLFFRAFVGLGLAPRALLLFGVVDALAAFWTWLALKRSPRPA